MWDIEKDKSGMLFFVSILCCSTELRTIFYIILYYIILRRIAIMDPYEAKVLAIPIVAKFEIARTCWKSIIMNCRGSEFVVAARATKVVQQDSKKSNS